MIRVRVNLRLGCRVSFRVRIIVRVPGTNRKPSPWSEVKGDEISLKLQWLYHHLWSSHCPAQTASLAHIMLPGITLKPLSVPPLPPDTPKPPALCMPTLLLTPPHRTPLSWTTHGVSLHQQWPSPCLEVSHLQRCYVSILPSHCKLHGGPEGNGPPKCHAGELT